MKKIWKLLMLGVTVLFLLQSCVTVRKSRHPPSPQALYGH